MSRVVRTVRCMSPMVIRRLRGDAVFLASAVIRSLVAWPISPAVGPSGGRGAVGAVVCMIVMRVLIGLGHPYLMKWSPRSWGLTS